jgi:hypothetical protein
LIGERSERSAMKRSQHRREIARRRAIAAPIGKRARGCAIEIDDHEVVPGVKNLSEMQISMAANAND